MPQRKSLLKKVTVEIAQRQRECKHTRSVIARGEQCIVVFDGPQQRFCYSRQVALGMLEDAHAAIVALRTQLE